MLWQYTSLTSLVYGTTTEMLLIELDLNMLGYLGKITLDNAKRFVYCIRVIEKESESP